MTDSAQENLALRTAERWQPPAYVSPTTRRARVVARVRRFFDIQAGSVWHDLAEILPEAQGTVVDVGCGAQPYRGLLRGQVRYVGLDTADAAEHFGYAIPDVVTIAADGRWPLDPGSADMVLATETLEHVEDPDAFLTQAQRCLRAGGRLVLTVPFAARWHYVPHDYWRFTPSSLRMLLERAGFEDVVVTGRGNERTVACYKVLALLLPLVLPQSEPGAARLRPLGLVLAPAVVALAAVANLTLRGPAGDDCLGFTAIARRSDGPPSAGD